ncbi:PLP-dependent aminotransferase family protein [Paraburkholderia sp. BL27I4N3]|uniref:aminotransferase-like domain-containing protein n=1 Tax=Paraburkholderia sp. BL27I4N3 TaxID=1938805 RepID=UPI0011C06528|nr:PLP-dependent aminotransferase family protein [Paraburkholderia sp. BL27I4N3]
MGRTHIRERFKIQHGGGFMWSPKKSELRKPLYVGLVESLEQAIATGAVRVGERLPPQRGLASSLGVTLDVVTQAYQLAESKGLIVGMVGRGTFVGAFPETAQAVDSEPRQLVDLRMNTTMVSPFNESLNRLLGAIARRKSLHGLFEFHPGQGMEAHRAAGAHWLSLRGLAYTPDEVVVCDNMRDALLAILAALSSGRHLILTESLRFADFRRLAALFGIRVRGVAMDVNGLSPQALREAARGEAVAAIFCSPTGHDPTNITMPLERRHEIIDVARELDCLIVEDDTAGHLAGDDTPTLSALAPDRCIYICGTNRSLAVGLRIGYAAMRGPVRSRLDDTIPVLSWTSSALLGEITSTLIESRTGGRLLNWHRQEAVARQQIAADALQRGYPPLRFPSYHLWLPMAPNCTAKDFAAELLAEGVAVLPASAFSVDAEATPECVRISMGGVRERERLAEALAIVARVWRKGAR